VEPAEPPTGEVVSLTAGDARTTSLYQYFGALHGRSWKSYRVCFWPAPGHEFKDVPKSRFDAHTRLWHTRYPKLKQRDCNVTFWMQLDGTQKYAVTLVSTGEPVDFPYMKEGRLRRGPHGTQSLGWKIVQ
jgi:hypothetical protein